MRNPQKIQEGRCSKFITEGFIICRWPTGPRNPPPPPNAHRARLCHVDRLWVIVSTFALLGIDSGFTAMSSGVRVPSEFAVHTLLDNFPVESPTDKDSCTRSVYKCIRKGMPLYTLRRRYYKPVRWMLRHNVAPHNVMRRCKLIDGS